MTEKKRTDQNNQVNLLAHKTEVVIICWTVEVEVGEEFNKKLNADLSSRDFTGYIFWTLEMTKASLLKCSSFH